jgi:DnaJ-class molecular chaperone
MPHETGKTAAPLLKTHYDVLGLDHRYTALKIKKAYKTIALDYHSDRLVALSFDDDAKAAANSLFVAANAAQETLLHKAARTECDFGPAINGLACGDCFCSIGLWVDGDGESDTEDDSDEEEEHTYAKGYQGTHAGLS